MGERQSTIDIICGAYDRLPGTEAKVADFVVRNASRVPFLSVREIAESSGTSAATVSRFVRHIGFDSFSDLRMTIASEEGDGGEGPRTAAVSVSTADVSGSLELILETKVSELRATAHGLDPTAVSRVVDLIQNADSVVFAAVGNSIPVCANLAFKLGQIGIRCQCPATTESMILASLSLRPTDVLVLVSSSGYSRRLETIIDNAEDSSTPVVLITSNPAAPFAPRADCVLHTVSRDHALSSSQFSSHISADFVVEALFLLVMAGRSQALEHARMEHKSLGRDKMSTPTMS